MSESLLEGGQAQEAPAETTETQITDAVTQAQPELLLGKYKTADDLAKAYKELESKLGGKEDDLRNRLLEELQEEAFKDRPASAGEYQLPESIDETAAVNNELLQWWSEHAFENGYSQEEFEKGIEMYAQAVAGTQPDLEAESKKLGENAGARIQAASMFANKFFPQETLPAIERMCESAEGIIALEAIMEALKDGSFSGESAPAATIGDRELREMMQDERYYNPAKRDPHFVKQVEEGFKRLYG